MEEFLSLHPATQIVAIIVASGLGIVLTTFLAGLLITIGTITVVFLIGVIEWVKNNLTKNK